MTNEPAQKIFQLRLDQELFERFFRAFPGRGERKLLLERVIELLVELADQKDAFVEAVLQEARERYYED